MELHQLDGLIIGLGIDPTEAQLEQLYEAFQKDFISAPLMIDGLNVKVVLKKSTLEGYVGYPETFVHLITRKGKSGKRVFDRHRANKINWIRCILENRAEEEIEYFEYTEGDGTVRDYYWYKVTF